MAVLDNLIRLSPGELSPREVERIKEQLTFQPNDTAVVWAYRERRSTGELWLPRGALSFLPAHVQIKDKRSFPKLPKHETNITLDLKSEEKSFEGQRKCVEAMFKFQQGLIHRAPGTGKTQLALYFLANVGTRSLVIVHTEDILNQWVGYAKRSIPDMSIGVVRQSQNEIGQLTIATIQTLYRRNFKVDWWRQFGCVIADEVHHYSAKSFDHVIVNATARYKFGLSASKTRADNMQKLFEFQFGETIHELKFSSPVGVTVEKTATRFTTARQMRGNVYQQRRAWHGLIKELIEDPARNRLIAKKVNRKLADGRSVLVLSRRIEHLQLIQELLDHDSVILAAALVKKPERKKIIEDFRAGKIKCILATQLADEAIDIPILSCICLTYPAKHSDLLLQQVGRALREYKGKHDAVIIDMVDPNVRTLKNHWYKRRAAYIKWGFTITSKNPADKMVTKALTARRFIQQTLF